MRLGRQTSAGQRSCFHNSGIVGLASVRMHMETLAGRACRDRRPSLVDGVSSPLKAIYLYLLLGVKLVSEAETAAGALSVAV